jgi:hypothetical protein
MPFLTQAYDKVDLLVASFFNHYLFHVADTLNSDGGGSGDTSAAWAQVYSYLVIAALTCSVWSIFDRKRIHYAWLDLWFRNLIRYFVCMVAFSYGIIKLFALQMPFPNLSQLATPLGDFLPMRLSWMFLGYSTKYQVFSGVMEVIVGLLLLNRKTVTPGALVGVGVFANVTMLNLSYDIPVKIFSIFVCCSCLYLLISDWKRVVGFFVLNQTVEPDGSYRVETNKKWKKIGRVVLKLAFIISYVFIPLSNAWSDYKNVANKKAGPIVPGLYDVKAFIVNHDTLPNLPNDTLRWENVIFDKGGVGSVGSRDTLFRQRYRRGYFLYQPDTNQKTIAIRKTFSDTASILTLRYQLRGEKEISLKTKIRGDSVRVELRRSHRHFQLAERQFHWLSEANR